MEILQSLLPVIKDVVLDKVKNNSEVPADKKDLVVDVTSNSLAKGLTDNIGDLAGLFTGDKKSSSSITDKIQESVINSLIEKTGLSSGTAGSIISSILPLAINALKNKLSSGDADGFDLGAIIETLGKDSDNKGGLGDIAKSLGKFFG